MPAGAFTSTSSFTLRPSNALAKDTETAFEKIST